MQEEERRALPVRTLALECRENVEQRVEASCFA